MDFMQFIDPTLLVIVPVLWIIGKIIKDTTSLNNKHIPLALGLCGVGMALARVFATVAVVDWQSGVMAAFTAFVQGILCAGLAVYGNQVLKQYGEDKK